MMQTDPTGSRFGTVMTEVEERAPEAEAGGVEVGRCTFALAKKVTGPPSRTYGYE